MTKTNKKIKMPRSPLRFPGSKSRVLKRIRPYLEIDHDEYREPFVGGGSIFFGKPLANNCWINDKDPNVFSFFEIIRDRPIELCNLIRNTYPTIELWKNYRNREISLDKLEKAFNLLFFNRTNYSGIYTANPIGGIDQSSEWKIDCRWNPEMLCERILSCSEKLQGVTITNTDFEEIITSPGNNVLLIIDPPYYEKGHQLYPVSMSHDDHVRLAELLRRTNHNFLLTIDDNEETRKIYSCDHFIVNQETWLYTVNSNKEVRDGKELFISNFQIEGVNITTDALPSSGS